MSLVEVISFIRDVITSMFSSEETLPPLLNPFVVLEEGSAYTLVTSNHRAFSVVVEGVEGESFILRYGPTQIRLQNGDVITSRGTYKVIHIVQKVKVNAE